MTHHENIVQAANQCQLRVTATEQKNNLAQETENLI